MGTYCFHPHNHPLANRTTIITAFFADRQKVLVTCPKSQSQISGLNLNPSHLNPDSVLWNPRCTPSLAMEISDSQ